MSHVARFDIWRSALIFPGPIPILLFPIIFLYLYVVLFGSSSWLLRLLSGRQTVEVRDRYEICKTVCGYNHDAQTKGKTDWLTQDTLVCAMPIVTCGIVTPTPVVEAQIHEPTTHVPAETQTHPCPRDHNHGPRGRTRCHSQYDVRQTPVTNGDRRRRRITHIAYLPKVHQKARYARKWTHQSAHANNPRHQRRTRRESKYDAGQTQTASGDRRRPGITDIACLPKILPPRRRPTHAPGTITTGHEAAHAATRSMMSDRRR